MDTLIRIAILGLLAPFWWPLLKTVLDEVRALLRGTGSISRNHARSPSAPRASEQDELVSIPFRDPRATGARRLDARGGFRPSDGAAGAGERRRRGA